ncbi:MAG: thiolase family protein [Planctomycetaceae bacterium]|nr:thiolase family protein [Planctomycetaceae bacterium]
MKSISHKKLLPPLAVVSGVRTPFAKAFTSLAGESAVSLGQAVVTDLLQRGDVTADDIDEVVFGNVSTPADAANIARVISLKSGIPFDRPAHSVSRNCASGMESIAEAWQIIREGRANVIVAGGTESMSSVPLLWKPEMQQWLLRSRRASLLNRIGMLTELRPGWLTPVPALELGLKDPSCGLSMGQTAEVLAREFGITRSEQDEFALLSHQRATAAWERCFLGGEVLHSVKIPSHGTPVTKDVGPRAGQSLDALARLKPIFDKEHGTVTAGNSCPITDGAAALLLMTPEEASSRGLTPLGYLRGYAVTGCDPRRMGLGPVYAMHRLLIESGHQLSDFDLFEINEAFAVQVLSCLKAMNSDEFARQELGHTSAWGDIPLDRLNINGGAIAIGHPVGTSGTRLILTLLRALRERGLQRGLASLCVGGGQGMAMWVERELEIDS